MTKSTITQIACIATISLAGCMGPTPPPDDYPIMTAVGGATFILPTAIQARGGATYVTRTRPNVARGGATSTTFVGPAPATCVATHLLTAAEIDAVPTAECNLLAIEPEPTLTAQSGRCVYEMPTELMNGSLGVTARRSTGLLRFTDGRVALAPNNTSAAADCNSGYRFVNGTQLELSTGACSRVNAGQAALTLIFGCLPEELTAQVQ